MTHRMIGAIRHYYSWPYMSRYISSVMFLSIVIITGHVLACGLLVELCEVGQDIEKSENFGTGIYCSPDRVVFSHSKQKMSV